MNCPKREALENAIRTLSRAAAEARNALGEPDKPDSRDVIGELALGPESDQRIRDVYHDIGNAQGETQQELQEHLGNCPICRKG
jgi:hypothetical protein